MRKIAPVLAAAVAVVGLAPTASASTAVPGHQGRDGTVTGHYTQSADGCDYIVNYRGDFGDDAYLDNGWIMNKVKCDDGGVYSYLFVHESDPRYTGDPERAIWGTWEWAKLTAKGEGNLANPNRPQYDPSIFS